MLLSRFFIVGATLATVCCVAFLPLAAGEAGLLGHGLPSEQSPEAARDSPVATSGSSVLLLRGPYLQLGTSSSITVRWRTDVATSSRVIYGSAPGSLNSTEEQAGPTTDHVVVLSGLEPDTQYFYAVGDDSVILVGDDADHFFVTPPWTGTSKPTRIWVLGDSGTGNSGATAVRDAYYAFTGTTTTDLWLMLGDNAYPTGTDAEYQTALFDIYPEVLRQSVLWPSLGNHDAVNSNSSTQLGPYFDMFTLPFDAEAGGAASGTEAYYSFDYANVHFVVLDSSGSDRSIGSPMLTWLEQDLVSTAQDWIVAYWHHPPYSKGSHNSDTETPLIQMRENAVPILEDHGVDLVLSGHSHSYERSYLIDGHYGSSETLADDMLIDAGDGQAGGDGVYWKPALGPEPHHGAVYTVAGCSGKTSPGTFDHPVMHVSMQTLGSLVLDVDADRLDVRFLESTGVVTDSFTIIKGCADSDRSFTSLNPAGSESHVFTPGLCEGGPPCSPGNSVSPGLTGSFWLMGEGDPAQGAGTDSGGSQPLQPGNAGWVKTAATGLAYIDGTWSTSSGVDGCIGLHTGEECMALSLADQVEAKGYFATLSAEPDPSGDYYFDQPGNEAISLAPIPAPFLTGSQTLNPYTKTVDLFVDPPDEGVYLDDSCPGDVITGYRIYEFVTGREDPPPDDRAVASGWTLSEGGELAAEDPLPLGQPTVITITCYTALNYYLGSALVFDSGFELPMVSETPFYILCSNCEVDDDLDGSCSLYITGQVGEDCDDGNDQVYPGAPQLCGDLQNNDCSHPSWPDLAGTNEFDDDGDGITECQDDCDDGDPQLWEFAGEAQSLLFAADKQTLFWTAPAGGGFGPLEYDVLRSEQPYDFQATALCLASGIPDDQSQDGELPDAGSGFYYLIRSENACGAGSLGHGSDGVERAGPECL